MCADQPSGVFLWETLIANEQYYTNGTIPGAAETSVWETPDSLGSYVTIEEFCWKVADICGNITGLCRTDIGIAVETYWNFAEHQRTFTETYWNFAENQLVFAETYCIIQEQLADICENLLDF